MDSNHTTYLLPTFIWVPHNRILVDCIKPSSQVQHVYQLLQLRSKIQQVPSVFVQWGWNHSRLYWYIGSTSLSDHWGPVRCRKGRPFLYVYIAKNESQARTAALHRSATTKKRALASDKSICCGGQIPWYSLNSSTWKHHVAETTQTHNLIQFCDLETWGILGVAKRCTELSHRHEQPQAPSRDDSKGQNQYLESLMPQKAGMNSIQHRLTTVAT